MPAPSRTMATQQRLAAILRDGGRHKSAVADLCLLGPMSGKPDIGGPPPQDEG